MKNSNNASSKGKLVCVLFLFLFQFKVSSQLQKNLDCSSVQRGCFYLYPKGKENEFLIFRNDSIQTEIESKTRDTSFWRIKWLNSCSYCLDFITQSSPLSKEDIIFLKSQAIRIEILEVRRKFYIFEGYLSNNNSKPTRDTVWRRKVSMKKL